MSTFDGMKKLDKRLLIIVVLSVLLFSANLSGISIYILDEAKNSTAAREMLDGNHIVPTFNYELRTDKPPLHYYFMMLSYTLFGVNEFGARFFSACCGIAFVMITFFFTRKFLDKRSAFWSALVLLSSIQVIIQFHMAVPDPYLIFFFTLTLFAAYSFYIEKKRYWLYVAYAAISLAVLAKGPVALLLAGAVWFLFLVVRKDLSLKTIASFRLLEGFLIMCALIIPWYVVVHIQTKGAWTNGFFFTHNFGRFTNTMEGHGGSFLLIPLYVVLGLFPFSLFIIPAIRQYWKKKHNSFLTLCAIVGLVVIVFFSLSSTKLPSYPAPSFAFLAVLLGFYINKKIKSRGKTILATYIVYFLIATAFPIAVHIVLEDVMGLPEIKTLAYWFLLLPLGAVLAVSLFLRNQTKYAFMSICVSWVLTTLIFFYNIFPQIDQRNAVAKSLQFIKPSDTIYYYGKFNPSFAFYAKRKISSLPDSNSVITQGSGSVVVLSMQHDPADLNVLKNKYHVIQTHKEFFEPYFSSVLFANSRKFSVK
jgi:4-amino-4-deoxy-L-arabinose transferase-like glycosyltransferase